MAKYIIKYGRDDRVKYISHLDFVRCFHRAVRRSRLNFEFSQGFNPHPVMMIAQPMPVAVTSECEYMRVGFVTDLDDGEIQSELERAMPPGFKIYGVRRIDGKEIDLTKINKAEYIVQTECDAPFDTERLLSEPELIVPKKTKSGIKNSDIRPHIFELESIGYEDGVQTVRMILSCGSQYNLKPQTVIEAAVKYCDGYDGGFTAVHRKRMFIDDKDIM